MWCVIFLCLYEVDWHRMNKSISFISKRTKTSILLICTLFMIANTCPIRSLLVNAINPTTKSVATDQVVSGLFVYDNLQCVKGNVTKAAILDFSKSGITSLPFPLLLTIISSYLSLSVIFLILTLFRTERDRLLTDDVPLFLKNRSIII